MTHSAEKDAPQYWVSYRSVVHRTAGKCAGTRYPWDSATRLYFDRACRNCMPEGLPTRVLPPALPLHRTEAGYPNCSTCDGGGCPDCTDPA